MSKYTTGEMAKLCGVSVRTVQYYDTRNILVPSELSEGGRRLYTDDDLKKMRIICFLRGVGISISSIAELLSEENTESVITILLEQQEQVLNDELSERQMKLDKLMQIKREIKSIDNFSIESIGDIAVMMSSKKKLSKLRLRLFCVGIGMDIIEVVTAILWWRTGIWQIFAAGMCIVVALGSWISAYYFKHVAYICPQCHEIFRPKFKEAFFARHTPKLRKLTCTNCSCKSFCVEIFNEEEK